MYTNNSNTSTVFQRNLKTRINVTIHACLSLWQGHRHTLLCILDCAAHLLPLPKEVEANFLKQTIKVFTKVNIDIRWLLSTLFKENINLF